MSEASVISNSSIFDIAGVYWRAVGEFGSVARHEKPGENKAVLLVGKWDDAVAALGERDPGTPEEAAAMQAVALDCYDRGEWTDIQDLNWEFPLLEASVKILRRVSEYLRLWNSTRRATLRVGRG